MHAKVSYGSTIPACRVVVVTLPQVDSRNIYNVNCLSEFYVLYLIRMNLYTTVPVVNTKLQNTIYSVKERREEEVNKEINSFMFIPHCLLLIGY